MNMSQDDWTGLGASLAVHVALFVLFAFLTAGRPDMQPLGVVQVEMGAFAEGQPVQQAAEERPETSEPEPEPVVEETESSEEEETQPPEEEEPAPESTPVELPDQEEEVEDEEEVETPEEENIAPEEPPASEDEEGEEGPPAEQSASAEGSGSPEGDTGASSGDDAEGTEQEESAPYDIEGLNREPINSPLPGYTEQVNAVIRVRVTVDPQGRVVERIPLIKGNPELERSVMRALQRWRFNPLPQNAPQENQTGIITFRFRLE